MNCLNLCEILNISLFNKNQIPILFSTDVNYDRIYFGSYFCSNYFEHINFIPQMIDVCNTYTLKCTLVVPVFTQKALKSGKAKIDSIIMGMKNYIDEITVNDIGMLTYILEKYSDVKVNLGRLFFKDARDPRIVDLYNTPMTPALLDNLNTLVSKDQINMIEIDKISSFIDLTNEYNVGIHSPLTYVTSGFICKYASVHKDIDKKFRPNAKCEKECLNMYEHYVGVNETGTPEYYKIGRAVYCKHSSDMALTRSPERYIIFPFEDIINSFKEKKNEYPSSIK